jgi:hypothetical protein
VYRVHPHRDAAALNAIATGQIFLPGLDFASRSPNMEDGLGPGGDGGGDAPAWRGGAALPAAAGASVRELSAAEAVAIIDAAAAAAAAAAEAPDGSAGSGGSGPLPPPPSGPDVQTRRPDGAPGPCLPAALAAALWTGAEINDKEIYVGPLVRIECETDLFKALGLAYIPPHLREVVMGTVVWAK